MGPRLEVASERFKDKYMNQLAGLLREHGLLMRHERDRATLDLGIELVEPDSRELTGVRVWLQVKGRTTQALSLKEFGCAETIGVSVPLEYVRYWYREAGPVYLVLYVEAAGIFLAEDVQDVVNRKWGPGFLGPEGPSPDRQASVTLHMRTSAVLDDARIGAMRRHRMMRIDGPRFRGRALGHSLDPLRCTPHAFPPETFARIVGDLLESHGYRKERELEPTSILEAGEGVASAYLTSGYLRETYEWAFQGSVEFGYSVDPYERAEGGTSKVQGRVAVLVVPEVRDQLRLAHGSHDALTALEQSGVTSLLVIANAPELSIFHPFNTIGPLFLPPQGLEGVAYSLLVATDVFARHHASVQWEILNTLPDAGA